MAACCAAALSFIPVFVSGAESIPLVHIEADANELLESAGDPAQLRIVRDGSLDLDLHVSLQAYGAARAGRDYQWLPSEVVIPAGAASTNLELRPIDNWRVDGDRSLTICVKQRLAPFSLVLLPDTQYYTAIDYGGVPAMFTAQTQWAVNHQRDWNIAFLLHEGDCTDGNTSIEWSRARTSMSVLDGVIPYAIAAGNHDGLMTSRGDTALFNQFFPLRDYSSLPTFGGAFESNRMDNVYHLFSAGGVDWLLLALEFGPRDEVLDWAASVVTNNPSRKIILLTHTHIYTDNTLHGSSPTHLWTPRSYGRMNDGVDVWNKLVRKYANFAFVFNGHVLNTGQGRLVGTGDNGNRVYQMLCNYQQAPGGGNGYMRVIKLFPEEDRLEAHSFSAYTGRNLLDPANEFAYTNLGIFTGISNSYAVDPSLASVTMTIVDDDLDLQPPAVLNVSARGVTAEIRVTFDEPVDPATATNLQHYSVPGVELVRAQLSGDGRTVALTPAANLDPAAVYKLVIDGVADASPQQNVLAQSEPQPFRYLPVFMADDFGGTNLPNWTIVDQGTQSGPSRWGLQGGQLWQGSKIFGPDASSVSNRQGTIAVWNSPDALAWSNYTFVATLSCYDNGSIGVVFRYVNPSNYYKFEMDVVQKFRKLTSLVDGAETLLACDTNVIYAFGYPYTVRIEAGDPDLRIFVNDRRVLSPVQDHSQPLGTVGFYSWRNTGAMFDDVMVAPGYRRPTATISWPTGERTFYRGTNITVNFNVTDTDAVLDHVELLDGGNVIATAALPASSLTLSNVPAHDFTISVRAVDRFQQSVTSPTTRWHVLTPPRPFFLIQPQNRTASNGGSAVLWGKAWSSLPFTYQWSLNGTPIADATNAFLFVNGLRSSGVYTLSAINLGGETISMPATVTIVGTPSTTVRPLQLVMATEAILEDGSAIYSVSSPTGLSLQIEASDDLVQWVPLALVTNVADRAFFTDDMAAPRRFYRATLPSQ